MSGILRGIRELNNHCLIRMLVENSLSGYNEHSEEARNSKWILGTYGVICMQHIEN